MLHRFSALLLVASSAGLLSMTSGCGDDSGSGGSASTGATTSGTTSSDASSTGSSSNLTVEDALDAPAALASLVDADSAAAAFCGAIDDNPNYTSNTVFSTGGKAAFAGLIRDAYGASTTLQQYVQMSGYWAQSGEPLSPDAVIIQTDNSCETNIGFINAVCFASGPQYTSGGSYIASEAVNTGGCDEAKL